jgi:hypothetical protein
MKYLSIILAALAVSACAQEITIENERAQVTSVGPLSIDERGNLVVPFTLLDHEGDDQAVAIEICDSEDTGCGPAAEALGGDPLDRLPTVPKGTDVPHEFRWQPWCGRWLDGELEPAALDDEYVVGLRVVSDDGEPVYSEPFSLAGLGAPEPGECP